MSNHPSSHQYIYLVRYIEHRCRAQELNRLFITFVSFLWISLIFLVLLKVISSILLLLDFLESRIVKFQISRSAHRPSSVVENLPGNASSSEWSPVKNPRKWRSLHLSVGPQTYLDSLIYLILQSIVKISWPISWSRSACFKTLTRLLTLS